MMTVCVCVRSCNALVCACVFNSREKMIILSVLLSKVVLSLIPYFIRKEIFISKNIPFVGG